MVSRIFDAFFLQNCICWILFWTLTIIFDVFEEIIGKIIESRYFGICPIIEKIIDIGRRLPQIIGNFRELSAKLSISKMTGKLSKIYRYRKKWLIAHPYPAEGMRRSAKAPSSSPGCKRNTLRLWQNINYFSMFERARLYLWSV